MTESEKPNELSGEDLDMAVGGASVKVAEFTSKEESNKRTLKGEEHRKYDTTAREEKVKHK